MSNNHQLRNRSLHLNWEDTQPVGYLGYRLYSLGWCSGLHQSLPPLHHWLLSIFCDYRRGFTDGTQLIDEYGCNHRFRK